ncbi:MAG: glycosyltransferase family 2 protein [Vulcanimicrobiaceae bacterium]
MIAEHLCAGAALSYALRCAQNAGGWSEIEPVADGSALPRLTIVVPARNEEQSIERCVRSLLAQTLDDVEVIVVDDRSTDATPAILRKIAGEDARLIVVHGEELPAGWVGKPWAIRQGVRRAHGDWLLFTDADTYHAPWASASALTFARKRGVQMVTLATGLELGTLAERALLPSILGMVVFAFGPIGAINDPSRPDRALANGQYIMIERTAYESLGGHASVHDRIAEDVEFARAFKRDGRFRMLLAGGARLCSVRMYRSTREIWDGFTKNLFLGAGGRPEVLAAGIAYLLALGVAPPVLAVRALTQRRKFAAAEAVAALATVIATSCWAMGEVGIPRRLGVYAPFGLGFLAAIAVNSGIRGFGGRGVEWRGRRYGER